MGWTDLKDHKLQPYALGKESKMEHTTQEVTVHFYKDSVLYRENQNMKKLDHLNVCWISSNFFNHNISEVHSTSVFR